MNHFTANKQNFHFFSQLTAKTEDLSGIDFQNAMLFPDRVHKLMISSRQNSCFFLKCKIFYPIYCIKSQLFHRKMAKFILFSRLLFKMPNIFHNWLLKLEFILHHNGKTHAFFLWFVFKTQDVFWKWLHKFKVFSKQNEKNLSPLIFLS